VFHPLSYNNNTNSEHNTNSNSLSNIQLKEFGQTPEQIFFKPHPKRYSKKIVEIPLQISEENNNKIEDQNSKINKEEELPASNNKIEKKEDEKNNIIDKDKKNEIENDNENKIEENKNSKIQKYNNKGNIISKPFPVAKEIDLSLKKKYKSVIKYDDSELLSGALYLEKNFIISGGVNGHLNIYDYYTGDITKTFSLPTPIENIESINKNNLIIYSSNYSIGTFNISSGKNISSFYAHENRIFNLFYDDQSKNIISCTQKGIIHIWDINQKIQIPILSHFLFDQNFVTNVDYNKDIKFFYSLDEEGNISIFNIYNDEEVYTWTESDSSNRPISICANHKNLNEFIIGYEKGFKIFDIRNYNCVEDWTDVMDFEVNKCIIDNNNILIQNNFSVKLFDGKEKKLIEERNVKDKIKFFKFYKCLKNDTRITYGNEKGSIFYSVV
jgi:WD40 repeat protein